MRERRCAGRRHEFPEEHHGGRRARLAAGIYGCILGPVSIAAVCSGLLTPDVHGFGMLVVCQAIWFVAVGVQLCGESPSSA
ncbi:MAG TPA: hypothetical protein VLW54_12400 [Candidatus Acidoferrales bacterium]|nr:hypothetical protein [Candidatus Acidoferrales bacterium]